MEKRTRVVATFIMAVLLVMILYNFSDWFSKTTGYLVKDSPENDLAICLAKEGSKLYGSKTCPDCRKQKEIFGEIAFDFLNYIECSSNPQACSEIKSVPAWNISGNIYYGVKNLDELRILSGCDYK